MITREDATTGLYQYFERAGDENTCSEIINEIYDSIGTCGECKRGILVDGPNDIDIVECDYEQTYSGFYEIDNFCKDFKRKEND